MFQVSEVCLKYENDADNARSEITIDYVEIVSPNGDSVKLVSR